MSNMFSTQYDQMDFVDGTKVAYSLRIDRDALAQYVFKAAKTKKGKSKLLKGAIIIEAKKL